MDLENTILKLIRGEKRAPVTMGVLAGLSYLYRFGVAARNLAYDHQLFSSTLLPVPVVSVGNIIAGGTGKTPLIQLLASHLQDKVKLAILTRGFRSEMEKTGQNKKISSGLGPFYSAQECGDEPYLLAQKTKAAIWVGADRVSNGQKAIEEGANCLLLDDGMQYRQVKRDVEIVVIDATNPFSKGRFLPWGLLRDCPTRLKKAHWIVVTHVKDEEHFQHVQKGLAPFTSAPLIGTQIEVQNKAVFSPRKVGLFCGIGQPLKFLQTARDLNQEIVDTLFVKDHGFLKNDQLQVFAKRCREQGAEALLCTEKDVVKLSSEHSFDLSIVPVEIRLKIFIGQDNWEMLINHILDKVSHERGD